MCHVTGRFYLDGTYLVPVCNQEIHFIVVFSALLRGKLDFIENDGRFPLFQLDTVFKLQAHEYTVKVGDVIEQIPDFN